VISRCSMSTNLFEDLMELEPFAAHVQRTERTVRRWLDEPNGLPYTQLGNRILIHVPTARDWLMSRMRNVSRDRPSKVGARRNRTKSKNLLEKRI
jgi:hypothetical protein